MADPIGPDSPLCVRCEKARLSDQPQTTNRDGFTVHTACATRSDRGGPTAAVKGDLARTDGNAFAVMGFVRRALRDAGATPAYVTGIVNEMSGGDYDNLLQIALRELDDAELADT